MPKILNIISMPKTCQKIFVDFQENFQEFSRKFLTMHLLIKNPWIEDWIKNWIKDWIEDWIKSWIKVRIKDLGLRIRGFRVDFPENLRMDRLFKGRGQNTGPIDQRGDVRRRRIKSGARGRDPWLLWDPGDRTRNRQFRRSLWRLQLGIPCGHPVGAKLNRNRNRMTNGTVIVGRLNFQRMKMDQRGDIIKARGVQGKHRDHCGRGLGSRGGVQGDICGRGMATAWTRRVLATSAAARRLINGNAVPGLNVLATSASASAASGRLINWDADRRLKNGDTVSFANCRKRFRQKSRTGWKSTSLRQNGHWLEWLRCFSFRLQNFTQMAIFVRRLDNC